MAQSLASFLTEIAEAIRTKKNTNKTIKASDFVDEVLSIGGDSSLDYTLDGTLPNFLANLADAIRLKRNITGKINAQDFAEEILKIESTYISYSSILGEAMLGYALLGDVGKTEKLAQPHISLINTDQKQLAQPRIYLSADVDQRQLITPRLSLDNSTGIITISNLDPDTNIFDVYIKGNNENTFILKDTWLSDNPTDIRLTNGDQAYIIAVAKSKDFLDSNPSNIVIYTVGQLDKPTIYLQTDAKLEAPKLRFADEKNSDYEVIITAVTNANNYQIFEYFKESDAIDFVNNVESTAAAGVDIATGYTAIPGSHIFIIAQDTTGTHQDSDRSNELIRSYGKLATPVIQLLDNSITTPSIRLNGNTVIIGRVDNADTYTLEIKDRITNELITEVIPRVIATDEFDTGKTLISNQSARVFASDSTGTYATSSKSDWVTYKEALTAPTVTADSETGVLSIIGSEHATHFEVYLNGSSNYETFVPNETELILADGDVIRVIAKDSTGRYLDSSAATYEHDSSLEKLSAPTNVRIVSTDVKFELNAVNVELVGELPNNATTDITADPDGLAEVTLTFKAADGYELPYSVSTRGVKEVTWKKDTGELLLKELSNVVTISIIGMEVVSPELKKPSIWLAHTVTWLNEDGSVIKSEAVKHGETPTYVGVAPNKAGTAQYTYAFTGWEPSVTACTKDVTYTAKFNATINTYTVTWENTDGTVLEVDRNIPYGSMPTYNGTEPVPPDAQEGILYEFNGWDKPIVPITCNITYTAMFGLKLNTPNIWVEAEPTSLSAPSVIRTGDTLNIERVANATEYEVYVDDVLVTTLT